MYKVCCEVIILSQLKKHRRGLTFLYFVPYPCTALICRSALGFVHCVCTGVGGGVCSVRGATQGGLVNHVTEGD